MRLSSSFDARRSLIKRPSWLTNNALVRAFVLIALLASVFSVLSLRFESTKAAKNAEPGTIGATNRLGMNDGSVDWVNLMNGVRPNGPAGSAKTLTEDANGWPTCDVQYVLFDVRKNMPWNGPDPTGVNSDISGTYKLSFTGQATLGVGSEDPNAVQVQNQQYDQGSNTTTADLVVLPNHWLVVLTFTNTKRQASDTPGNGITNIKVLRPGYDVNTNQLFTNETINAYKIGFGPLRVLDLDSANTYQNFSGTSLITDLWADRVKVSDAYQGGTSIENDNAAPGHQGHGVAWEYIVALANLGHHDLWINIPHGANDDYVTNLARLLKYGSDGLNPYTSPQANPVWAPLDPSLKVYVEYSNEVWNFSFPQYVYNNAAAENEVNAGGPTLNNDGTTDKSTWGARRYAKRLYEVTNLFGNVYGSSAITDTIRPVFLWQYDTEYAGGVFGPGTMTVLDWFNRTYGPPKNYFYGIGVAPYYGAASNLPVDNIFDALHVESDNTRVRFIAWQTLASYYGLKQVGYESGPGLDVGNGALATRDPRMEASEVHHYLDNWFAAGGDVVNFFALRGAVGPSGDWLAVENFSNLNTPKLKGVLDILNAPVPAITSGYVLPATTGQSTSIDASQYAQTDHKPGDSLSIGASQYYDYLLRVPYTGTYTFALSGTQDSNDLQETLLLDNQSQGTVQLPTSTGTTTTVTATLSPGFHTLRINYSYTGASGSDRAHPQSIVITLTSGGGATVVPSAPGKPGVASVSDGTINLRWPTTTTAAGYKVYRSSTSDGPYTAIANVDANTYSYTDSGLTNGVPYYYVVTATNSAGESAYSPQLSVVPTHANKPAAPTGLQVLYSHNQTVKLSWTGNADASGYNIYRSSSSGTGYNKIGSTVTTSYTDGGAGPFGSNPANDAASYYVVTATNSFGESSNSNEISTTPTAAVLDPPTNLTATASSGAVQLQWNEPQGAIPQFGPPQYTIYRSTTSGGSYAQVGQTSVTNFQDVGLTSGTTYYYVVTANNGSGSSPYSGEASATPTSGTNPTPTPVPTVTPTPTATSTPTPSDWTFCANEGGTCSFSGTFVVRYGANGKYAYKTVTDGTACTNGVFGDPNYGVYKSCSFASVPPSNWTKCSDEGGTCSFSGTVTVAYGANGKFVYQTATNGIACNNATFGDPNVGVFKACYVK